MIFYKHIYFTKVITMHNLFLKLVFLCFSSILFSQTKIVRGTVYDNASKDPLPGVLIRVKESSSFTTSALDGTYQIELKESEKTLVFNYNDFESYEQYVASHIYVVDAYMSEHYKNEYVDTPFALRKKNTLVSSQSYIDPKELKIPKGNLTHALSGRASGFSGIQEGGAFGQDNATLFIRNIASFGNLPSPLLIVDGVPNRSIENINPEDIEKFTVLKDAVSTAPYGVRGANGVIIITTKRGKHVSKPTLNVEFNKGITTFTKVPEFLNAVEYKSLYNASRLTRDTVPQFTDGDIQSTRLGLNQDLRPNNVDWYDLLFNDFGETTRFDINASSKTNSANFYLSVGYFGEKGLLKPSETQFYDTEQKIDRFNITLNADLKISDNMRVGIGFLATIFSNNQPLFSPQSLYENLYATPIHIAPPVFSNGQFPSFSIPTDPVFGNEIPVSQNPLVGATQNGSSEFRRISYRPTVDITYDLKKVLKGLAFKGKVSIDSEALYQSSIQQAVPLYSLSGVNFDGSLQTDIEREGSSILRVTTSSDRVSQAYIQAGLDYERTFADFDISAALLLNQISVRAFSEPTMSNLTSDLENSIARALTQTSEELVNPFRRRDYLSRLSVGYKSKYFLETNVSYSGADAFFASDKRFGVFPSIGGGWIISKESFFDKLKPVISFFKLRGSYGKSGYSNIFRVTGRYDNLGEFIQSQIIREPDSQEPDNFYTFGDSESNQTPAQIQFFEQFLQTNRTWETSTKYNLGLDLAFMNNKLALEVDVWMDDRKDIVNNFSTIDRPFFSDVTLSTNAIISGFQFDFQEQAQNEGRNRFFYTLNGLEAKSKGVDITLSYNQVFESGFKFGARGVFNYNKTKLTSPLSSAFRDVRTSLFSNPLAPILPNSQPYQHYGLVADGLFTTEDEVTAAADGYPITPRVGDIKYRDLDGDGFITTSDRTAIGKGIIPNITYGLFLTGTYKAFDISIFLQGAAEVDFHYSGIGTNPEIAFNPDRPTSLIAIVNDHWSEENPNPNAFYPRLSDSSNLTLNYQYSTFWLKNTDFVRLKNLELGYTYKSSKSKYLNSFRFFISGANLVTLSKWKFWDPESSIENGAIYPNTKVYNAGLRFQF